MLFCFTNNKCQMAYIIVKLVFFKLYIYTNKVESSTSRKIEIEINSHTHKHIKKRENTLNRSIHTFVYTYGDVQLNWKMSI
jgi:hypothetical protein